MARTGSRPYTCAQAAQVRIDGRVVALNVTAEDESGRFAVFRVRDEHGPLDIEVAEGESADVPGTGVLHLLGVKPSSEHERGAAAWTIS